MKIMKITDYIDTVDLNAKFDDLADYIEEYSYLVNRLFRVKK